MAYNGIAWPGLALSIRAVTTERNKVQRWLRSMSEAPKGYYKNPTRIRTKWEAMLADLDTGLQVLRAAQKATERPRRKRTKTLQSLEKKRAEQTAS